MRNHLFPSPFLFLSSLGRAGGGFQGRWPALSIVIETHPFEPFLSKNATLLILGTFPPVSKRWSMPLYYPSSQNDMWRIFGYLSFGDRQHFMGQRNKTFYLDTLKVFLEEKDVTLSDTALCVCRAKNIASDRNLEIIKPADLDDLLRVLLYYTAALAAGRKAATVFTGHSGVTTPAMGQYVTFSFDGRSMWSYYMPSSSRAYPMKLERKAESYRVVFEDVPGLPPKKTE